MNRFTDSHGNRGRQNGPRSQSSASGRDGVNSDNSRWKGRHRGRQNPNDPRTENEYRNQSLDGRDGTNSGNNGQRGRWRGRQNLNDPRTQNQSFDRRDGINRDNNGWRGRRRGTDGPNRDSERSHSESYERKNGRRGNSKKIGFKYLESLCEEEPDVVVMKLNKDCEGLKQLLESELTNDAIVILVKLLKIICECTYVAVKLSLVQNILRSRFQKELLHYISELAVQSERDRKFNSYFWKDTDEFWYNLIAIFKSTMGLSKNIAYEYFPKLVKALLMCIANIEKEMSVLISEEIKSELGILNETLSIAVKEEDLESHKKIPKLVSDDYDDEPPNDFRDIDLYPCKEEITVRDRSFIRKNVIFGPYKSVEHYLDVQYRLLREDFVGPLRDGICNYLLQDRNKRSQSIRLYKEVEFLCLEVKTESICYRVRFTNNQKKQTYKYENSKRFMFGALLCFTHDNFKTLFFGKVVERDTTLLNKGELIVGFENDVRIDIRRKYLMVESNVYFEPYYHVLSVLKSIELTEFPMQKYIIEVDNSTNYPKYLTPNCIYKISNYSISPFNWREVNCYGHNESQKNAFKAALTQEFAIIQGPPGTGKTYLGLNITKTLLENHSLWYKRSPILVICYTNHALDQFLEGLVGTTDKIVRVGGQSKNETLQKFNLRNRTTRRNPAVAQMGQEVRMYLGKLSQINKNIESINNFDSVVKFHLFEDIPAYRNTWFSRATNGEILDWLFYDDSHNIQQQSNRQMEVLNNQLQNLNINKAEIQNNDIEDSEDENEDLDEYIFGNIEVSRFVPLVSLIELNHNISASRVTLRNLQEEGDQVNYLLQCKVEDEINTLEYRYMCLEMKLREVKEIFNRRKFTPPKDEDYQRPNYMTSQERWSLYFYFLQEYITILKIKHERLGEIFRGKYKEFNELRSIDDSDLMKRSLVVGMTTTGAARLRPTLESLKNPIVIVEEAAEVLESHIVASVTKHCQHLILIGDHQQLKPSTSDYFIETKYNLGISLFERMVNNKIQLHTLNVQHRMRPEISSLICPTIYPNLLDHESVKQRPPINGIDFPLYFIDHDEKEALCQDESKKNVHEAKFLMYLCRHLILNGYKPDQITVLAAYLGQMYEMQHEKKRHSNLLRNVRIAVLDNYQGEESDIILLSLVRSNNENSIGFLKNENRLCVALSRARNGMYVMGNMNLLENNSEIWPKIKKSFEDQNAIGRTLKLRCQIHTTNVTHVQKFEDFLTISEGGCTEMCNQLLVCGHTCTSICHVTDRIHSEYKCSEICNKILCSNDTHVCRKRCFEECGPCTYKVVRKLQCGHIIPLECYIDPNTYNCLELVETKLFCGHTANKPCHRNPDTFRCPHPCDTQVEPCGHSCSLRCHARQDPDHLLYKCLKPCAKFPEGCANNEDETHRCKKRCYEDCGACMFVVKKERICTHVDATYCHLNVDDQDCLKPCKKVLPCGHKCKSKCYEPCKPCETIVKKNVPDCNHEIKIKCFIPPTKEFCRGRCPRKISCGHNCLKKCNELCTTPSECTELVDCAIPSPCGHIVKQIKCGLYRSSTISALDERLLEYCTHPCNSELLCEHICSGTCGTCYQSRIHIKCTSKCGALQICNHECKIPCRQACKPCPEPCEFKCEHSKCKKLCGEPCTSCKERCSRRCEHNSCKNMCGMICSVPPCNEPCKNILSCGHNCIGFCGDKCPPLCRVCDKEQLENDEIFFVNDDYENARYVLLLDCEHVFESIGMEGWLSTKQEEITVKVCPKCKVPIITTPRYSDYVKAVKKDILNVKATMYGSQIENTRGRNNLSQEISSLSLRTGPFLKGVTKYVEVLEILSNRLKLSKNNTRQRINKKEIKDISLKVEILKNLNEILQRNKINVLSSVQLKKCEDLIKFIIAPLIIVEDHITKQEVSDMEDELNRLLRLVQFFQVQSLSNTPETAALALETSKMINKLQKFTSLQDDIIKKNLDKLSKSLVQITDRERHEIVKAISEVEGSQLGHWFKCPNGHPYYIGECGGAMQEAKCFCGAKIGGLHHTVTAGNQLAREMDGSRYAAWSDTANMHNYEGIL